MQNLVKDKKGPFSNTPKLVADLKPKFRYKLTSQALKAYCALGMEVDNVYRIVKYRQEAYYKDFVCKWVFCKLVKLCCYEILYELM